MTRVLLMKAGEAAAAARLSGGDYDRWFQRALRGTGVRFTLVQSWLGERPKQGPRAFDAVMMTGSPLSATAPVEWMRRAGDYLVESGAQGVPTLGVCFGLQLVALALGERVVRNPRGREIGTVQVALTPAGRADSLFEGVPSSAAFQTTHEDIAERLPKGATLLATNARCEVQAFAVGKWLRAVQFHPELDPGAMKAVIDARAGKLAEEAAARGEAPERAVPVLHAGLRATPAGRRVMENFVRHFT